MPPWPPPAESRAWLMPLLHAACSLVCSQKSEYYDTKYEAYGDKDEQPLIKGTPMAMEEIGKGSATIRCVCISTEIVCANSQCVIQNILRRCYTSNQVQNIFVVLLPPSGGSTPRGPWRLSTRGGWRLPH